jgi:hypothetical protein
MLVAMEGVLEGTEGVLEVEAAGLILSLASWKSSSSSSPELAFLRSS